MIASNIKFPLVEFSYAFRTDFSNQELDCRTIPLYFYRRFRRNDSVMIFEKNVPANCSSVILEADEEFRQHQDALEDVQ